MQVTTAGDILGQINYQVFPLAWDLTSNKSA